MISTARRGSIALFPFLAENIEEEGKSLLFIFKEMHALLATRSHPAPVSNQGYIAEQCWLDRQQIKARHVLGGVDALDMEAITMPVHEASVA